MKRANGLIVLEGQVLFVQPGLKGPLQPIHSILGHVFEPHSTGVYDEEEYITNTYNEEYMMNNKQCVMNNKLVDIFHIFITPII